MDIIITRTLQLTNKMFSKYSLGNVLVICAVLTTSSCALVPGLSLGLDPKLAQAPSHVGGYDFIEVNLGNIGVIKRGVSEIGLDVDEKRTVEPDSVYGGRSHYRIGPGDILTIIVWGHPELTSPTGEFRDPEGSGRLVGPDGKIFYPYVGELKVDGLTVSQVRRLISSNLARVVKNPQVDIRVAAFRSKSAKVLGAVNQPTTLELTDVPLEVLDAVAKAGGLADTATRSHVFLFRNGERFKVDLNASGMKGGLRNYYVRDGDLVYVPDSEDVRAYVMGAVENQTTLHLPYGEMTLSTALSEAGGLLRGSADSGRLFIVRPQYVSTPEETLIVRPQIYYIDVNSVSSLVLFNEFVVREHDIVYVSETRLSSYNKVIEQILPTVSTLFQLDRLFLDSN